MKDYDDKKLKSVTKEGLDIDETDDEKDAMWLRDLLEMAKKMTRPSKERRKEKPRTEVASPELAAKFNKMNEKIEGAGMTSSPRSHAPQNINPAGISA